MKPCGPGEGNDLAELPLEPRHDLGIRSWRRLRHSLTASYEDRSAICSCALERTLLSSGPMFKALALLALIGCASGACTVGRALVKAVRPQGQRQRRKQPRRSCEAVALRMAA